VGDDIVRHSKKLERGVANLITDCEDRVGANVTKDPNKIKVFTQGFDGHTLAATYYFEEEIKNRGITFNRDNPESINSLKDEIKDLRQQGKSVTFGATYGSTHIAVSKSLKISKEEAQKILDKYWEMYAVTKKYWGKIEKQILSKGFVTGAFGLKVRSNLKDMSDDRQYASILRTMVNTTIQSFALLMVRTIFKLQERIEKQGYIEDIIISNTVHDSVMLYVKPDTGIIKWLNDNLIELMTYKYDESWEVDNEADLEIGYSVGELEILSNNATLEEIEEVLNKLS